MNRMCLGLAGLAVVLLAEPWSSEVRAAGVKPMVGLPTGVVVTLNHREAHVIGKDQRLNIPVLPKKFEAPLHRWAGKILAADKGNGVKVTLIVKVFPKPGIGSKVESR